MTSLKSRYQPGFWKKYRDRYKAIRPDVIRAQSRARVKRWKLKHKNDYASA